MEKKVLLLASICILTANGALYSMNNGESLVNKVSAPSSTTKSRQPASAPGSRQKGLTLNLAEADKGAATKPESGSPKAAASVTLSEEKAGEKQEKTGERQERTKKDKEYETVAAPSAEQYAFAEQPPVSLGLIWWASTRASRVNYALAHAEDARSTTYLKTQDGRHEVGRELHDAIEALNPQYLTSETPSLATIMLILTESEKRGVEINRAELMDAWKALKKTKAGVVKNLDERLKEERERYAHAISALFAQESELVRQIAATQHTAARMRHALNDKPNNESDDEGTSDAPKVPKEWNRDQVFAQLSIRVPKTDGVLGVAITLEDEGK
ncbi:MAG: hypothetical protein NT124_02850 [Candidatus Dependentiae bacterium]|nr:hypothetical protein [Candidatus Dependentiae bacterium]